MAYKCIILDHDDTVVDSTATVHYPAFLAYMDQYKGGTDISLKEYFTYNFHPGVLPFFQDIVGLNEKEMEEEERFWRAYGAEHIPAPYPGMAEILWEFRRAGGLICVSSHSYSDYIRRDYQTGGLPEPDRIYGWELPAQQRKPDPWSVLQVLGDFHLASEEVLVLDDLKPGYDMARAAGVPFAAAAWAGDYPDIQEFMKENSDYYLDKVENLRKIIL